MCLILKLIHFKIHAQLYSVLFKVWRVATLYGACGSINLHAYSFWGSMTIYNKSIKTCKFLTHQFQI